MLARVRAQCSQPAKDLQVKWPASPFDRVKKIVSRSGVRRRYVVPCYRFGAREAHGEAREEEAACILLDACAGIEFQDHAACLTFQWLGETHKHTPDLLVASEGRCEFWECKREREAGDFWIRKRAEHLTGLLAPWRVGYRVVSGHELYGGSYLTNAKLLRRHAKRMVSPTIESETELQLRRHRNLTIGHLEQILSREDAICDVLALIYSGKVVADIQVKLTTQSEIRLPTGDGSPPWVWQLFDPASA